ncbi:unnamed protein product [Nesidiocoris tenuis]|uniref:Chitin-binding type-2 domain-containing protein n=1 Tax=Nesidiocoris tenuis TaxID=355587 RepID=A0A6H5FW38_9HEMI|nr:unnamed protein product [Nesidiocoris tenuis]
MMSLPKDESWLEGRAMLVAVGENTCKSVFSCADCNTARLCRPSADGSFVPLRDVKCPASAPFCNGATGTCGQQPDATCGQADNFVCLQDGHFPDVECHSYHVCEGLVSHKFDCVISGEVYDADAKKCVPSDQCAKFTCGAQGTKAASDRFPGYFAYCDLDETGKVAPLVIDQCQGINTLNTTSQLCEPICQKEGVLEDTEDCTKYYKCHYLWVDETTKFMVRERMDCPANTAFLPSDYVCVNMDQYPECKAKKHL